MRTSLLRTRWAAIGAAIAVSLGAGGIGISHATTSSGERPIYVPIDPCRLADIRPDTIGPDSSRDFDGWGTTGDCTLPTGTSGLALNVTAVGATQQTNLRFHPQGTPTPDTANLNPTPGAPPTPNAVNVSLNDANGKFTVYNRFGNVSVVIDVMGYYDHHTHDDRYYTEAEVDGAIGDAVEDAVDMSKSIVEHAAGDQQLAIETPTMIIIGAPVGSLVRSVTVDAPDEGTIAAMASMSARGTEPGRTTPAACTLTTGDDIDGDALHGFDLDQNEDKTVALVRGFDVTEGETTISLFCRTYWHFNGFFFEPNSMDVFDSSIVATYIPA